MLTLDQTFKTNANQLGIHTFTQVKKGTNPVGKSVCIYKRENEEKVMGYEVVIPNIKKAGIYALPGGKTITYAEDFQEYPGASLFGKRAWFCATLEQAEARFNEITAVSIEISDDDETEESPVKLSRPPKTERSILTLPEKEFSVKELAELNKVEYVTASQFIKELESAGSVNRTRTERRSLRGKPTQLFSKVSLTPAE